MSAYLKTICAAAALSSALLQQASAGEIKADTYFGWLSVGTNYTVSEGHLYWVGEFSGINSDASGSILDNMASQCPAWYDVDFPNNVSRSGGYCINTLTTGDTFMVEWTCESRLIGATGAGVWPFGKDNACVGKNTVVGATGALKGLTGKGTFLGHPVIFHPDGKGSGFSTIQYSLNLP